MINILYCDYCNWKKLTRDFSELGIIEIKSTDNKKRFRCPSCGRLIISKTAFDPQKDLEIKLKQEKSKEDMKKWMEENLKFVENFNKEIENEQEKDNPN